MPKQSTDKQKKSADGIVNKKESGLYISPLEDYPGSFRLPHPFLGRHYKAWWRASSEELSEYESTDIENLAAFSEWRAALALIEDWDVEGLPFNKLDPSGDDTPTEVMTWVRQVTAEYIAPKIVLKNLPALSETS